MSIEQIKPETGSKSVFGCPGPAGEVHPHTAIVWSPAFTRFLVSRAVGRLKAGLQTSALAVEGAARRCTPAGAPGVPIPRQGKAPTRENSRRGNGG